MKIEKPTLEDEFYEFFAKHYDVDPNAIWNFFVPHLKKQSSSKPKPELPLDKIKEFNELWPTGKLPTGQYARCSESELVSSFNAFFKQYPTYNDWEIIMQSAKAYLNERENEKWEYTRRSKYFVRREMKDKSVEHLLGDYYDRILKGEQPDTEEAFVFDTPVY